MWLIRLYVRVLGQLGSDLRIGGLLALANVALAVSAFAEPILFGRIIDVLTRAQMPGTPPVTFTVLMPLIIAWVAFALLLHRRRSAGRALCGPALAPPAARRGGELFRARARTAARLSHLDPFGPRAEGDAGRLERHGVALARLLPRAFRRARRPLHPAAPDGVPELAPRPSAGRSSSWSSRSLTTIVVRKTESLQGSVERYHSSLAEHASDALGNVPVIQSFTRVEAEARIAAGASSSNCCRRRTRSCPGGRSPPSRRARPPPSP